jgi:hypothetical protein
MREKKKKIKKLTWSLINAPLCSCMYIQGEERKKQQGKEKKTHWSPIVAPLCICIFKARREKTTRKRKKNSLKSNKCSFVHTNLATIKRMT